MSRRFQIAVLSDIHYAGPREQAEGDDYETRVIANPFLRFALRLYREHIWLRYPLRQNGQLDRFIAAVPAVDYVIANGDYSCNTSAVGLSDDAAMESAQLCIGKLRSKFGERLRLNFGDHELGKLRLMGTRGGLRLRSWDRGVAELGIQPFWRLELGRYVLFNCVSTLIALPVFEHDVLPGERAQWLKLREQHFDELRIAFASLQPRQRVIFFCHDPTALPFLARDETIKSTLAQVEHTIIGHLHSKLYLRASTLLSGLPVIRFCGHSIRRMSTAVNEARHWKAFHIQLCPSLGGIELLNDGGFLTMELNEAGKSPAQLQFHSLRRQ
ncbi:MAG TPA: metallophosphoesterase [Verrucomicrobiae bacterium]|nr:metallophosphoesterase [Verrucomicrobiae bacterium]